MARYTTLISAEQLQALRAAGAWVPEAEQFGARFKKLRQ